LINEDSRIFDINTITNMSLHRILLPILFCIIPILLLNSIGRNINVLDMKQVFIDIYDSDFKVTFSDTYYENDNIIAMSCDAIKNHNGTYISYSPAFIFDVPCFLNSPKYNAAVLIMFLIIIGELIVFLTVSYLFHQQPLETEAHVTKRNKIVLFIILFTFLVSIFCDIYSSNNDAGVTIFYGNKIYDIAGEVYVLRNKYDLETANYRASVVDGVSLSRSICDGTHFIAGRDNYFFKQMIKISKCDRMIYILAPAAMIRCAIVVSIGIIFAADYYVKKYYDFDD